MYHYTPPWPVCQRYRRHLRLSGARQPGKHGDAGGADGLAGPFTCINEATRKKLTRFLNNFFGAEKMRLCLYNRKFCRVFRHAPKNFSKKFSASRSTAMRFRAARPATRCKIKKYGCKCNEIGIKSRNTKEALNKSAAAPGGSFAATFRFENLEIHKVFLRFSSLNLRQNLSPTALAD